MPPAAATLPGPGRPPSGRLPALLIHPGQGGIGHLYRPDPRWYPTGNQVKLLADIRSRGLQLQRLHLPGPRLTRAFLQSLQHRTPKEEKAYGLHAVIRIEYPDPNLPPPASPPPEQKGDREARVAGRRYPMATIGTAGTVARMIIALKRRSLKLEKAKKAARAGMVLTTFQTTFGRFARAFGVFATNDAKRNEIPLAVVSEFETTFQTRKRRFRRPGGWCP